MTEKILEVNDLKINFNTDSGTVQAIRDVYFDLKPGETLALVGESGSGKSVTTRALMGLLAKNARIERGSVQFKGKELIDLPEDEYRDIRGSEIAMIFQDPMTSLDPTMKIGQQIAEPLIKHQKMGKKEAWDKALDMMNLVGIPNAEAHINDYPHQFSGGMRQRIVIAIALIDNPEVLIADEPTTALDVTIQAQILDLMKKIQKEFGTSIIFITHDLGVVAGMADRVAVMYAGQIVEIGTIDEIYGFPQHPYTWGLLNSMPTTQTDRGSLEAIPGTPPDLLNPPVGDAFAARNQYALAIDEKQQPPYFQLSPTHFAATLLLDEQAPEVVPPLTVRQRWAKYQQAHPDASNKHAKPVEASAILAR